MESLLQYDKALLKHINAEWHNRFLDVLLPVLREPNTWIPLYIFLLIFIAARYKKQGWWWIAFAIVTVIITNFISSDLIKHNVMRLRPCNDPANAGWIRTFKGIYLPKSSSFTSSHATNHFGMAMFFYATLKKGLKRWAILFFIWAISICYAQMYIGVHYPLDILCGTIIGLTIGYITSYFFDKNFGTLGRTAGSS